MEIILGIGIALLGLLLVVVIKLSTTFFHELGHAIPALFFTKKSVEVYIGSYGDISNATSFEIGRLKIFFKWNLLDWQMGMCRPKESVNSIWKNMLIILGGPIASLLIALPLLINLKSIEENSFFFFISIVFIGAAVYDFFVNIIPRSTPLEMHDGNTTYCDGYQLYNLFLRTIAPTAFFELENKFLAKEYEATIEMGNELLKAHPKDLYIYEYIIEAMLALKDPHGALEMYRQLGATSKLAERDYLQIGKIHHSLGNYEEALKYFEHFRYKNYKSLDVLQEIGKVQIAQGNYQAAVATLNSLLHVNQRFLPAYLARGRAHINLEAYSLAEHDLKQAQDLAEKEEPTIYYLEGLLNERLNRKTAALVLYERAKALGCEEHGLDYKIEILKSERK